jgi:hypothetical protein
MNPDILVLVSFSAGVLSLPIVAPKAVLCRREVARLPYQPSVSSFPGFSDVQGSETVSRTTGYGRLPSFSNSRAFAAKLSAHLINSAV